MKSKRKAEDRMEGDRGNKMERKEEVIEKEMGNEVKIRSKRRRKKD